jgi:hypothetical protein
MTDAQLLTIIVAIVAPFLGVMVGVLINNHRLNDVKELFKAQIETRAAQTELAEFRSETRVAIAELRALIDKNHSEMMLKITEVENRRVRP